VGAALARRLVALYFGLALFGVGIALMVQADLGLDPWDVLHQGISDRTGISLGVVVIAVAFLVTLAWIPLRERPGLGTVSNVVLVGLALDAALAVLPRPDEIVVRYLYLAGAIAGIAIATALYIGAGFGPGPRDGLMTGLARGGRSISLVRTCIELAVLVVGFLLGGTVGIGTLVFAVGIGPVVELSFWLLGRTPLAAPAVASSAA
jgi:uncharacterized membrane protein YczE